MHLYFLMKDGKYLHKESNLNPSNFELILTSNIGEARYWDSLAHAKGLNTKLHRKCYKTYIMQAKVEPGITFGEYL